MTVAELKPYQDKIVVLSLSNGEIATVKVFFVDEEYEDVIVDILRTTHPETYEGTPRACYVIPVVDIESAAIGSDFSL